MTVAAVFNNIPTVQNSDIHSNQGDMFCSYILDVLPTDKTVSILQTVVFVAINTYIEEQIKNKGGTWSKKTVQKKANNIQNSLQ